MDRLRLPAPGPAFGGYPERPSIELRWWQRWLQGPTMAPAAGRCRSRPAFIAAVHGQLQALPAPGSSAWQQALDALRAELGRGGLTEPLIARAFSFVARCAAATLSIEPYDTQLVAARIMLDNKLAEMATGEGKTLATAIAAATAALAGVPVHVVTANPYLAVRDAADFEPLYAGLALTVRSVAAGDTEPARREAYRSDIVYATAPTLIFDYLRDRLARESAPNAPPLLRGLCMALVDEADSVLIDEARTPFVLAGERRDAAAETRWRRALALALPLRSPTHFHLDAVRRRASLTPAGGEALAAATSAGPDADPLWRLRRHRQELAELALAALHLYRRDVHYLVRPDTRNRMQVEIVDPTTGRVAAGRRWSGGLHQLVELKEGLPPSPQQHTMAQLSFQRFFPRYWRLAGTSGTLRESSAELRRVYRLGVETVPLRRPSRRGFAPPELYAADPHRWQRVVERITALGRDGAAVLVGVDAVHDAEQLAERLQAAGIPHQRLDARQDGDEAARIARAGEPGCVTVATQMAGRGTDIRLTPGVEACGGLQVICCQHNASPRIDHQLHGRCARAGDPGRVHTLLALDAGLLGRRIPLPLRRLLAALWPDRPLPTLLARVLLYAAQAAEARRDEAQRAALWRSDRQLLRTLGFGAARE